ncbi:hypothetical protein SAMN05660903_02519 [Salegentibacter salinarum]|nr:hypothetical protein [Salegentibacter salinarum]SKB78287.1 hypothetical protein SAMN05660903_02519 [Salegentibacter salinarum]
MKINNNTTKNFMLLFVLVSQIFFSCNVRNDKDFSKIERERDSLKTILNNINQKYVFDNVRIVTKPSSENVISPGNEYNLEVYFIGYNNDSYFKNYDSINNNSIDSIYPQKGIFHFKTILEKSGNEFKGLISTNSEYGKNYEAILHNPDLLKQ